ncbi:flagellar hook-length control protein FliK [Celeribacter sp. ULVN23_4]
MTDTSVTPEQDTKAHQLHSPIPPADTVSIKHMTEAESVTSFDVTSRPDEASKVAGNAPTVDTAEPLAPTKTEVGSANLPIMGSAASMIPEAGDDWRNLPEDLPGIPSLTSEHTAHRDAASLSMPTRLEWSPRLAAQIAEAARQIPDRPVEITLSPEELGKVRLSFHLSENGAMQVVIAAERADTLDLLRRNVESLSGEFRDLGYSDSGFTFQNFDQGAGQQAATFEEVQSSAALPSDLIDTMPLQTPVRLSLGSSSGMDLRL